MGSTGSKIVKKIVSPFSSSPVIGDYSEPNTNKKPSLEQELVARKASKASDSPVILKRQGSMFFDEDGDLAHEFYFEEVPTEAGLKPRMIKVVKDLTPQGDVIYDSPRLSSDYPIVLYQA